MRIIHFKFQSMVVAFGVSIALFSLSIVYLGNRLFFARSQAALLKNGITREHPVYFFVEQQQLLMNGAFLLALAFGMLASVIVGFVLSDRVAGPLFLMREHFLRVSEGAMPTRFHFRKTDFFQEVADAYNLQLEKLDLLPRQTDTNVHLKMD